MIYLIIGLVALSLAGGLFGAYERQRVVAANARADLFLQQRDAAYDANQQLRTDLAELRKTVENVSIEWGKAHDAELAAQEKAAAAIKEAQRVEKMEATERAMLEATLKSPPTRETYTGKVNEAYESLGDLVRASRGLR
jgi:ElaB/YqjD/DUF883 family membrane-anchored ribosome-binding protein